MAVATAAVANNGTVFRPRLVTTIVAPDGKREPIPPSVLATVAAGTADLNVVRAGMRDAVLGGSAQSMQSLPTTSAAKTGTAQFGASNENAHSWYTVFAPYEDPRIALTVVVENGGEGHDTALPVAREVLQWYFSQNRSEAPPS